MRKVRGCKTTAEQLQDGHLDDSVRQSVESLLSGENAQKQYLTLQRRMWQSHVGHPFFFFYEDCFDFAGLHQLKVHVRVKAEIKT